MLNRVAERGGICGGGILLLSWGGGCTFWCICLNVSILVVTAVRRALTSKFKHQKSWHCMSCRPDRLWVSEAS